MDDLQFRREIYADPKSNSPEILKAKNTDPAKLKFAQEVEALDDKISNALNIPVPDDLCQTLILRQSLASHQQQKRKKYIRVALAASITLAIGLTVNQLQFSHAYDSVGDYAIAHVNHEAKYFSNSIEANIPLGALNKKMASFNGSFTDSMGDLLMAEFCRFDGIKSLHMVFRGKNSPVNIFVVPQSKHLSYKTVFDNHQYNGIVSSTNDSHIIVVGDKAEPLKQWQLKLQNQLRWFS
ncbi:DUF3379 family protein [Thalassotalea sp. PP2-459]|uniref:DUF3379 family protein n=1 Tax=Thalassotalea sp. PP2-459 TaxID=1742724 RepID=UPI0009451B9C|nr:DUF3379 family protein [Thalassotalea sp. PP2-459]OKY24627.1 hypothetical protein BI291_05375 [Thalassotalea sp. PP2-459]